MEQTSEHELLGAKLQMAMPDRKRVESLVLEKPVLQELKRDVAGCVARSRVAEQLREHAVVSSAAPSLDVSVRD